MVRYFQKQKYIIIRLISLIGRSSIVVGLVVQFGLSSGSIYTVVLGGSIGAAIALRDICVVSERKYCGYTIDLVCDFGYYSRSRYFVRSVCCGRFLQSLPPLFLEYRPVVLFWITVVTCNRIVYYNTIVSELSSGVILEGLLMVGLILSGWCYCFYYRCDWFNRLLFVQFASGIRFCLWTLL